MLSIKDDFDNENVSVNIPDDIFLVDEALAIAV